MMHPLIPHSLWALSPTLTTGPRSLCCTKLARVKGPVTGEPSQQEEGRPAQAVPLPAPAAATKRHTQTGVRVPPSAASGVWEDRPQSAADREALGLLPQCPSDSFGRAGSRLQQEQRRLGEAGGTWSSVTRW